MIGLLLLLAVVFAFIGSVVMLFRGSKSPFADDDYDDHGSPVTPV